MSNMHGYKPLKNEELTALKKGEYGYDAHWRHMDRLCEQARLANVLAEAAQELIDESPIFYGHLRKALAAYYGEES